LLAATLAMAIAIGFLGLGVFAPAVLVVVYGIGIGLSSIAHRTVPLALFGQKHYARLMGRFALPSLLAQAAAPLVGPALIQDCRHQTPLLALGVFVTLSFHPPVSLVLIQL